MVDATAPRLTAGFQEERAAAKGLIDQPPVVASDEPRLGATRHDFLSRLVVKVDGSGARGEGDRAHRTRNARSLRYGRFVPETGKFSGAGPDAR